MLYFSLDRIWQNAQKYAHSINETNSHLEKAYNKRSNLICSHFGLPAWSHPPIPALGTLATP